MDIARAASRDNPAPGRAAPRAVLALLVAVLALVAPRAASQNPQPADCPHSGVKRVASEIKYGGWQECGTGIQISQGGLSVHSPKNMCPTFAIYEPMHDVPTRKEGFYTVPGGVITVVVFTFECQTSYLFGLIPIGSSCLQKTMQNVAGTRNYLELPCNPRFRGGAGGHGAPGEGR